MTGEDIETLNNLDEDSTFVIYLHGKIIEDEGIHAVHPEHGRYEYLETLSYLAASGAYVISEVRQTGTDPFEYAKVVTGWIRHLLDTGVPAQNITVVGFSKGAAIAIHVSDMLDHPRVNFVLIAICGDWIYTSTEIRLTGRVLSLFETSDTYGGSCQGLIKRSPDVSDFSEVSFSTGEGHGAFYQADSFWLDVVIDWIQGTRYDDSP